MVQVQVAVAAEKVVLVELLELLVALELLMLEVQVELVHQDMVLVLVEVQVVKDMPPNLMDQIILAVPLAMPLRLVV